MVEDHAAPSEAEIRKVIYAIHMALDGCFDHTNAVPDEEVLEYYIDLVRDADLFAYGRETHESMVPYWPDIATELIRTWPPLILNIAVSDAASDLLWEIRR
jgi:hypothetical protein